MTARPRRGRLVVLEGIDGVGKTTLVRALARTLRRGGSSVAVRSEPADPRLGALAQSAAAEDAWTGAVYFTVDRHLAAPALERDLRHHEYVLQDRSFYSTLAYQGSALAPREARRLTELQRAATREPDTVVLLDLSPSEALARLGSRGSRRGPLEQLRTMRRVARAYRSLARQHAWLILDARKPTGELVSEVLDALGTGTRTETRRTGRRRR